MHARIRSTLAAPSGWLTLTLAASLLAAPLAADKADKKEKKGQRFELLSLEHGLSQSSVFAILQDPAGDLWLGSQDGLNHFDGEAMQTYTHDPADADSLPASFVRDMFQDASGRFWLATEGGGVMVTDLDSGEVSIYARRVGPRRSRLASDYIKALIVDRSGIAWIGTRDAGLDRLDPATGTVKHFVHSADDPTSLPDDRVRVIREAGDGALWIGTASGFGRFDPESETFERYLGDEPVDVRTVFEDSEGVIWVGTEGKGLIRLDAATGSYDQYLHDDSGGSLADNRVRALLEDSQQRLWVGTRGGLDLFNAKSDRFRRVRSVGDASILALHESTDGTLWLGCQHGGAVRVDADDSSIFSRNDKKNRLEMPPIEEMITAFAQDHDGRLFLGTLGGGLTQFDAASGETAVFRSTEGDPATLADDGVMALLTDRGGRLWVGTRKGGLSLFDPATSTFRTFRHDPDNPSSLGADGVMSLHQDESGTLWVGTFGGGLNRFNPETSTFERFMPDPEDRRSLASARITFIADAGRSRLWVGTDGGGLSLFNTRSTRSRNFLHSPKNPNSLPTDTVFSIYRENARTVWVGTMGSGLARLRIARKRVEVDVYTEAHGLPNATVYSIQPDTEGGLWLSTNQGLSRFDPAAVQFVNFDQEDGLHNTEFNFGASFQSSDGQLFFGGLSGFDTFYPGEMLGGGR